jgi:DNA-directed RNA polymerase specialized sigma24 family protein
VPSSDVFGAMLTQMRITNRLLYAQLRRQMKQNEVIALLETTGASLREIADVIDTTPATVQTTLARLRKKTLEPKEKKEPKQRLLPGM